MLAINVDRNVGEDNDPTQNSLHWASRSAYAYIAVLTRKRSERERAMRPVPAREGKTHE